MEMLKDEKAQGAAEYILLFGGIIIIAVIAAVVYKNYLNGLGNSTNTTDVQNVNSDLSSINVNVNKTG